MNGKATDEARGYRQGTVDAQLSSHASQIQELREEAREQRRLIYGTLIAALGALTSALFALLRK